MSDPAQKRTRSLLDKKYGQVLFSVEAPLSRPSGRLSVSPVVDRLTGGGLREGTVLSLAGKTGCHKTTLSLCLAAAAQAAGRHVYYVDVEAGLTDLLLDGIEGLSRDPAHFTRLGSSEGNILPAETFLNATLDVAQNHPGCFIIIDSISALSTEKELAGGVGTETRGGASKPVSQFMRCVRSTLPINRVNIVGIIEMICNTSGMGAHFVEKSPEQWKYHCDHRLRATKFEKNFDKEGHLLGADVTWHVDKNRHGRQFFELGTRFTYSTGSRKGGVDAMADAVALAEADRLVVPYGESKSVLSLAFLGDDPPRVNGRERLKAALLENEAWLAALKAKLAERHVTALP